MKTTLDLVQELRSLPDAVYENFCNQAKMVALEYPSAHGIDCFARGETIEFGFIDTVGQYKFVAFTCEHLHRVEELIHDVPHCPAHLEVLLHCLFWRLRHDNYQVHLTPKTATL